MRFLLLLLFLSWEITAYTQSTAYFDSLESVLEKTEDPIARVDLNTLLAEEYRKSNYDQALIYANHAVELSREIGYTPGLAAALYQKSWVRLGLGEFKESESLALELKAIGIQSQNPKFLGDAYNLLGSKDLYAGNLQFSLARYDSANRLYKKAGHIEGVSRTYHNLGLIYNEFGESELAISYYDSLLQIEGDKVNSYVAVTYSSIGDLHLRRGNTLEALQNYQKSVALFEQLKHVKGIAINQMNLGRVYASLQQNTKALEQYQTALNTFLGINHLFGACDAYNNIGKYFSQIGQFDSSRYYHQQALLISKKVENEFRVGAAYLGIGESYLKEDLVQAAHFLQQAKSIFQEGNHRVDLAQVDYLLGRLARERGQYQKAREFLGQAIEIGLTINSPSHLVMCYKEIAEVSRLLGQKDEALFYMGQHQILSDSLNGVFVQLLTDFQQFEYQLVRERDSLDISKARQEMAFQEERKELKAEQRLFMLSLVFSLIIIVGMVIFYYLRQKSLKKLKHSYTLIADQSQRINSIVETVSEGILEVSSKGIIQFANAKAYHILGVGEEELKTKNFYDLFSFPNSEQRMFFPAGSEEVNSLTLDYAHPEQGTRVILCSISRLNVDSSIVSFQDMTEQAELDTKDRWEFINQQELANRQIAMSLSESIAQQLYATLLKLDGLAPHTSVNASREILTETIKDIKQMAKAITPQETYHGIAQAVLILTQRLNEQHIVPNIHVEQEVEDLRFDLSFELAVFRILQELLENGIKHASAINIKVKLVMRNKCLELMYCDDGVGFDLQKGASKRRGLKTLKDRVEANNGKLMIESASKSGTKVSVRFENVTSKVKAS